MATRKSKWLGILATAFALLLSGIASGQGIEDWPTYMGSPSRVGYNGDVLGSGPGVANLRWFTPNGAASQFTTSFVVDNTDISPFFYGVNTGGSFSVFPTSNNAVAPNYGLPLSATQWGSPTPNDTDADDPWLEPDSTGVNERIPPYVYAYCTPSTLGQSPVNGATSSATWTFTPTSPAGGLMPAGSYALYVWIPYGPQFVNGVEVFPQEFFVYQISAGGRTYIDVVDTYLSGGGWVRLGNGGAPTNMVFPWDGVNFPSITLYNTIPYDGNGNLTASTSQCVYADAAMASPVSGYYDASPVSSQLFTAGALEGATSTRVVSALTGLSTGGINGAITTVQTGAVASTQYDTGNPVWTYSPIQDTANAVSIDNTQSSATTGWTQDFVATRYSGKFVSEAPVVAGTPTPLPTQSITYAPNLNSGTYQIYAYLPGNNNGESYGTGVLYNINEGTVTSQFAVNQSTASGWTLIGTRRYTNIQTTAPLTVTVTNASINPGDNGLQTYSNAIRFVAEADQAITSTPVVATVGLTPPGGGAVVQTQVDIVADENGVIHCLDAIGNADGTTKEYWSYPSTLPPGVTDPNQAIDAGAEMPSGFELSSALVQTINGKSYLYIGTQNGRVYCIDMAGRGDYTTNAAGDTIQIGTTDRVWTYPATGSSSGSLPASNLGPFRGSVTYGLGKNGKPTIYAPTTQGRIYALDAVGNLDRSTNVYWAFPQVNQPALGEIWTTPSYQTFTGTADPLLYFGTRQPSSDDSNGLFFCLDATNGNVVWSYAGDTNTPFVGDYLSGPAVVPNAIVGGSLSGTADGVVYVINQNTTVYAFDAINGTILWESNELNTGARGALTFTNMTVYNNAGLPAPFNVILIPTADGRFDALFADPAITNQFGTRRAYEFITASQAVYSSLGVSNNWMYGTDSSGFLYAFNSGTGLLSQGNPPPGGQTITENNPAGAVFRHAKMGLVTQAGYNLLRQPTGSNGSFQTYIDPGSLNVIPPYAFSRTPLAFEWGETAYILVYDFPFLTSNGTTTVSPPIVNITLSSQGKTIRTISVEARLFTEPPNAPDDPADPNFPNGTERDNGYAVLAFPFQQGGYQSIPPGPGNISISMSSAALNGNGTQQTIALNPQTSNFPFFMANPLALSLPDATGNFPAIDSVGLSTSPSDPENLINGNPLIPNPDQSGKILSSLGMATDIAQHGSSQTVSMFVIDRSMMGVFRPDGLGLSDVSASVKSLSWQGGHLAIYKRLNPTYYNNFEDYPDNYPNNSLDYPDIQSEQIQLTSNPNGTAQNPRFVGGVDLLPPLYQDQTSGQIRAMQPGDNPIYRIFQPTPWSVTVNVPKYQPANTNAQVAQAGALVGNSNPAAAPLNQGYLGRLQVFVDSNKNGVLDTDPSEAFRSFNLSTSVDIDEQLVVTTPTVDLGVLGQGLGYDPLPPSSNYNQNSTAGLSNNVFMPWGGRFQGVFQPFTVQNPGNVNLLDVRIAKATDFPPTGSTFPVLLPWAFYSSTNDQLGFLDGSQDLWSDIDATFAPPGGAATGPYPVALQKPRVTDIAPTQLSANPVRRANPNLGTTGTVTIGGLTEPDALVQTPAPVGTGLMYPPSAPRIAVSVPIGMPVGNYSNLVRVYENDYGTGPSNAVWQLFNNAPETFSDPTLTLNFTVRESQMTSSFTANTAPMVDNPLVYGPAPNANFPLAYSNKQPAMVRDPFGSLIVAWASDRPSWAPGQPTATNQLGRYSLFIATVGNTAQFNAGGISNVADNSSPLSDLDSFGAASPNQWFNQVMGNYPNVAPDVVFQSLPGDSVIPSTLEYGNPAFPVAGLTNPFASTPPFQGMLMAFTGDAQKQTPNGRIGESKLFLTIVSPGSGGNASVSSNIVPMVNDPQVEKGKSTVVQTSNGAMVLYSGSSGSHSNIYYTAYGIGAGSSSATFGPSIPLPFGKAFVSASAPSAVGRVYNGAGSAELLANGSGSILQNGNDILEMSFAGQLQGRSNPEIFIGRMKVDSTALVAVDDNGNRIDGPASDGNVFLDLPPVSNEILVDAGQQGVFRAAGVSWDRTAPIQLLQVLNGNVLNLLIGGTAIYDRETGLISYDTALGGKVYLDPLLGTVRFPSAAPNKAAQLLLSYTPQFLRITVGLGAGFAKPTDMYDTRQTSNAFYWRRSTGGFANFTDSIPNDRFVYTYNRAAGGAGLPPRPYVTTLRFGVQLPTRIATDKAGNPLFVQVNGVTRQIGYYQIDPANGRIYFTDADEDNIVNVSYTGLLENGQTISTSLAVPTRVSLVREEAEQQILMDNAVNESELTAFLDPFSYVGQRRPPLMWLFWTSSRLGQPDIYFETISPQWSPVGN